MEFYNRIQTLELNQDQLKIDISKKIFQLNPYGSPLTRLLSEMRTNPTISTKFKLFEDEMPPVEDTIAANQDPEALTKITVNNPTYFTVNSMVYVPSQNEVVVVKEINTTTGELTVERKYGETGTPQRLLKDETLIILHELRAEGDVPSQSRGIKTTTRENYVEEFSTTIEETDIASAVAYWTQNPRAYARAVKGIEHAEKIERQFWFGKKNETIDAVTRKIIRTTDGIFSILLKESEKVPIVEINGQLTEDDFEREVLPKVFRYNEKDKRILFTSSLVAAIITSWAKERLHINEMATKKYGMKISTYVSIFPDFDIIIHPLFKGYYAGWGVFCNMEALQYRPLQGKDTKLNPNYDKSNPHVEKDEYFTVVGLGLCLPQSFCIMNGITS